MFEFICSLVIGIVVGLIALAFNAPWTMALTIGIIVFLALWVGFFFFGGDFDWDFWN